MDIYENKSKLIKERDKQAQLREKYDIEEKVIVKETSNMTKFLIRTCGWVIRTIATILLWCLAAIGIITLIYPENRKILIDTVTTAFEGLL